MDKKNDMKLRIISIILFSTAILLSSCGEKHQRPTPLQVAARYFNTLCISESPFYVYPLNLVCKTDTQRVLEWSIVFPTLLNIQLFKGMENQKLFAEVLENAIEASNGYLEVDSIVYNRCCNNRIEEIEHIKSLYQEQGIEGILRKYVGDDGIFLINNVKEKYYIIDLLFQNDILCLCHFLIPHVYVDFQATEKEEIYKDILAKECRHPINNGYNDYVADIDSSLACPTTGQMIADSLWCLKQNDSLTLETAFDSVVSLFERYTHASDEYLNAILCVNPVGNCWRFKGELNDGHMIYVEIDKHDGRILNYLHYKDDEK